MDQINKFVDLCIIDEYAEKDVFNGYHLDLDDLPETEISNLADLLLEHDTHIRDYVRAYMQELLNDRLRECTLEGRCNQGITLNYRPNGDYYFNVPRGGAE